MNNEYGGLITSIAKIVEIISMAPEKMKELNLLQLAQVVDDVETLVGEYDKEFLLSQGITEKQAMYRGYLAYKIIAFRTIKKRLDIVEYIKYLSNKDYKDVLKNFDKDIYGFSSIEKKFMKYVESNRYRKNPQINLKSISDIKKRFNLDDDEEKIEMDGYFELITALLNKDGYLIIYLDSKSFTEKQYLQLIKTALNTHSQVIKYIEDKMEDNVYIKLLKDAILKNPLNIIFVNKEKVDNNTYMELIKMALISDAEMLFCIETKITDTMYIELFDFALLIKSSIFRFLDETRVDNKSYLELAQTAVTIDSKNFEYVNKEKIGKEKYLELAYTFLKNRFNNITLAIEMLKHRLTKTEINDLLLKLKQEELNNQYDKKHSL